MNERSWKARALSLLSVGSLPVMVICDGHPKTTAPVAPGAGKQIALPIPDYPAKLRSEHVAFSGDVTMVIREGMIFSANIGGGTDMKQRDLFAQALMMQLRRVSFPRDWPGVVKLPFLFTTDPCNAIHLPRGTPHQAGPEMQSHYGH
jgi:hypothetical protein